MGERLRDLKLSVDPDQAGCLIMHWAGCGSFLQGSRVGSERGSEEEVGTGGSKVNRSGNDAGTVDANREGSDGDVRSNGTSYSHRRRTTSPPPPLSKPQPQSRGKAGRRYRGLDDTVVVAPGAAFVAHFENLFALRWSRDDRMVRFAVGEGKGKNRGTGRKGRNGRDKGQDQD